MGQTTAFRVTGLTSDRSGANHQSATLLKPWGIAFVPGGNFFIAENAAGRVDSYDADGNPVAGVIIPAPPGSTAAFSSPTGIVAIPEADFLASLGSSGFQFLVAADNGDRKSTRLNSSHTVISYAVFCLKKKKKAKNVEL